MKNKFSMAFSLAVILAMLLTSLALADDVYADGDNVAPVAQNPLSLGNVCLGDTATGPALLAIRRQANANSDTVFANSSTVTISVASVSGTGLSAAMGVDNAVTLPSNWVVASTGTMSINTANSTISLNTTGLPLGPYTGTVQYDGTGNNSLPPPATVTRSGDLTVNANIVDCTPVMQDQTINVTISAPANAAYGSSFNVAATGGDSGNPVVITTSGVCSGGGDGSASITMTSGTGTCTVHYNQVGNSSYNAAPEVTSNTAAQKVNQAALSLNAASPQTYSTTQTLSTSGGSGSGAVSFSLTSGPCTLLGDQLTADSGTGSCVVGATKAADDNYNAASASAVTVALQKANQAALSLNAASPQTYSTTQTLSTSGGSGSGAVSFSLTSGPCTLLGDQLTADSGTGSCVVGATKAADDNYNAASASAVTVALQKANQAALSLNAASPQTYSTTQTLSTSGGSGSGAVSFSLTSGPCTLLGDQLTADSGTGSCVVGATKAADDNYNAASASAVTVALQKANQTITITTNAPTSAMYDTSFTVAATASSGLPVAYSASGGCSNVDSTFTMTSGVINCTVKYNQAGDDNYNAATEVTETVTAIPWTILGFYAPVDKGIHNIVKGGATVPLKFEVFAGSTELMNTSIVSAFTQKISCAAGPGDDIEQYSTGSTSLRYDTASGQFIFNWKTLKAPGSCYRVTLTTADGSTIFADFTLK